MLQITAPSTAEVPSQRFLLFAERLCKLVSTPGGRIFILLFLVVVGYAGAACGVAFGEVVGGSALITLLLVLARHPASPGLVGTLLSLFKKDGR